LVPIKGLPSDDAAIRLACQIAKSTKARVVAIHVIEVQRNLPLDSENETQLQRAEVLLGHAEQVARAVRGTLETDLLQARVAGVALVDETAARQADLIVMGIPYRSPLGDFQLGTTTLYLLKNAPCPVWLCREAAPSGKTALEKSK
jgi:nucleotide-binding universal stress UspA family protein